MAENNLVKPLLRGFVRTLLNSDVNCVKHGFCKYPILIPDKNSDYARRVLSSKPPTIRPRVGPNPKKMRFVVFTDVHVDYHYKEARKAGMTL